MLDFSMTKAAVIAVVSLIVLGPERLPRVARTAGALLGRAQRYIDEVKAEVSQEIELDKLQQWKGDLEAAAIDARKAVDSGLRKQHAAIQSAVEAVDTHGTALRRAIEEDPLPGVSIEDIPERSGWLQSRFDLTPQRAPRKNWRIKRAVPPAWRRWAPSVHGGNRPQRALRRPSLVAANRRRFL
ncbi:MAG: twin-arginine translocase TatA/TatE family subunit [Paraburkholderia sp.]|jgi:sec-independent protein translocase protein TatB|uniref:twin-arginine translocase TatA/TatE family subunit n=1 Tax=Burkholderiaceae TaxID=119060 RepID=UPI0010F7678D